MICTYVRMVETERWNDWGAGQPQPPFMKYSRDFEVFPIVLRRLSTLFGITVRAHSEEGAGRGAVLVHHGHRLCGFIAHRSERE